ncbi:MAG: Cys-Xaa-Xaa-Xaa repeat radical SAM target protein [Lentimicrobiaceae bacterium]|nr:Cys-Xaa-Xaa-Xaa repeat radical SAM target protein [Lentimicrobiaceae bacterium]
MKEKERNEEIQSRREFFKKAAKGALPILGALLLTNVPDIVKASENPKGCYGSCYGTCWGSCLSCTGTCTSCTGTCTSCYGTCWGTCVGTCAGYVYLY